MHVHARDPRAVGAKDDRVRPQLGHERDRIEEIFPTRAWVSHLLVEELDAKLDARIEFVLPPEYARCAAGGSRETGAVDFDGQLAGRPRLGHA
ncbi:MAG: hypothetical protein ACRETT_06685, partial [Steroidobacteraceae bacterium]